MKKQYCFALTLLLFTLTNFSASAQDNPIFRHISPDANMIFHINLASIGSKVDWADMAARFVDAHLHKAQHQEFLEFIKDPSVTGIDIKGDALITFSMQDVMDSVSYTTVVLHLADTAKFRAYIRKQSVGLRITRYPDKSYSAKKNKMGLAWNKDLAVIVTLNPAPKDMMALAAGMGKQKEGSKKSSKPAPAATPAYGNAAVALSLATLKGWASTAYTEDPGFKAVFSNDADIHISMPRTNFYLKAYRKLLPPKAMGGLNLDSLMIYKSSYSSLWFENGKIRVEGTGTLKPNVAEDLAKFAVPAYNDDLLARVPKGDLLGVLSFRMNLGAIGYMLNRIGIAPKLDSVLEKTGLSLADFGKAFQGNFLLAALMPPQTDSFRKPAPTFYVVTTINDPEALHKLGKVLHEAKDSTGDDSTGKKATMPGKIKNHFAFRDNILVLSGSKEAAEGYFSNTEKRNTDLLSVGMKDDQVYVWIDLKTIINMVLGPVRPDDGADKKTKMMNGFHVLDKMVFSKGLAHNGGIVTSSFELSVTNKDQNILKTIIDLVPMPAPAK